MFSWIAGGGPGFDYLRYFKNAGPLVLTVVLTPIDSIISYCGKQQGMKELLSGHRHHHRHYHMIQKRKNEATL